MDPDFLHTYDVFNMSVDVLTFPRPEFRGLFFFLFLAPNILDLNEEVK